MKSSPHTLRSSLLTPISVACALAALATGCSLGGSSSGAPGGGTPSGTLVVEPLEPFQVAGPVGGPFPSLGKTYAVRNSGTGELSWSVAAALPGLYFTKTIGVLEAGETELVGIAMDPSIVLALSAGAYANLLVFRNEDEGQGDIAVDVLLTLHDGAALGVAPEAGMDAAGPAGGPFSPASRDWTVRNDGPDPVAWSASASKPWILLDPSSGTLAPGQQETLTATLDATVVAGLAGGSHSAVVRIDNLTNGVGSTSRPIQVTVGAPADLALAPVQDFLTAGPEGGPFAPASRTYTVSNPGGAALAWNASVNQSWVQVAPSSGSLGPGEQATLVVSLQAGAAANLVAGSYTADVSVSGAGETLQRAVVLDVQAVAAGQLVVEPANGLVASGSEGGNFSPDSKIYTVRNTGGQALDWIVATSASWITTTKSGGQLAAGGQTSLTIQLDPALTAGLSAGDYSETVSFTNVSSGLGDTSLSVDLHVQPAVGGPAVLLPGSGFSGPTPEPPPIGSGPGSGARSIARWDVVPHQMIDASFEVGVVAFHRNGIDRVELSAEGGPWVSVDEMTYNPRTKTHEYWAILRASDFGDGPLEVRAIAYPTVGVPRVLESLRLNANAGGTLPTIARYVATNGSDSAGDGSSAKPFATIMKAARSIQDASGTGTADHGTIYLKQGSHHFGTYTSSLATTTDRGWLTITHAPGLSRADVEIASSDAAGIDTKLVRLFDVTVRDTVHARWNGIYSEIWFDRCELVGVGTTTEIRWIYPNEFERNYATDSLVRDNASGIKWSELQRNVEVRHIGMDAFVNVITNINGYVNGIDKTGAPSFHPDCLQWTIGGATGLLENVIVYNLRAYNAASQGIFSSQAGWTFRDWAFVNVLFEQQPGPNYASQIIDNDVQHLVMWHVTITGQPFWLWTNQIQDVSIRGCSFEDAWADTVAESKHLEWFADNHYGPQSLMVLGANPTTGSPQYTNPNADDYAPSASSPLKARVAPLLVPVDAAGKPRGAAASAGALE